MLSNAQQAGRYAVWDWPVRVLHWCLPVGIATMWWTGEEGLMDLHSKVGYGLLIMVATRLVWGVVGSHHARFVNFLAGPKRAIAYLRDPQPTIGHNPLGGWSALLLLTVVFIQAASGLFTSDDILFDGPLAYWGGDTSSYLAVVHEVNWIVLQVLIVLHLCAVALYQWHRRQPLIQAMLFGRSGSKSSPHRPRSPYLAVVIALGFAALLAFAVTTAPEAPELYW